MMTIQSVQRPSRSRVEDSIRACTVAASNKTNASRTGCNACTRGAHGLLNHGRLNIVHALLPLTTRTDLLCMAPRAPTFERI